MGPRASYRIGSLTKTYVSTAVLQLVAQHRVALDAPASRYLPDLLKGQPRTTVRQLLDHTSGIYDFNNDPRVLAPYLEGNLAHVWTPRRLVRIAFEHHRVSRPGRDLPLLQHQLPARRAGRRGGHRSAAGRRAPPPRVLPGGPEGHDLHHVADPARPGRARLLRVLRASRPTSPPSTPTRGRRARPCRPRPTSPGSTGACSRAGCCRGG